MKFRPWHASAIPSCVLAVAWACAALGSYVFLSGLGFKDQFEFPWLQLWIAVPYVLHDGWHGLPTLRLWSWTLVGLVFAFLPTFVLVITAARRYLDRRRQPSLYGKTGWADRGERRRGGIRTERSPF
jgi:hypothetical protein